MRYLPLLLSGVLLSACASNAPTPADARGQAATAAPAETKSTRKTTRSKKNEPAKAPEPSYIQIKLDNDGRARPRTETRPLFNIAVGKSLLALNGTPVKDLNELRAILGQYQGLVLTVAAHRCLESERAAEVLTLAQQFTNIPVTYGSFGDYGDAQCD